MTIIGNVPMLCNVSSATGTKRRYRAVMVWERPASTIVPILASPSCSLWMRPTRLGWCGQRTKTNRAQKPKPIPSRPSSNQLTSRQASSLIQSPSPTLGPARTCSLSSWATAKVIAIQTITAAPACAASIFLDRRTFQAARASSRTRVWPSATIGPRPASTLTTSPRTARRSCL